MKARVANMAFAALAGVCSCFTPSDSLKNRSPLLEAPPPTLTPEGPPAPVPVAEEPALPAEPETFPGEEIARTARTFLGKRVIKLRKRRFPNDCTGLVRAVYAEHGLELLSSDEAKVGDNGVTAIWRFASHRGGVRRESPRPGDLVFFRETYDRNRDGRVNDGLTHVGIVDTVEPEGSVTIIHRVPRGVVRYRMTLGKPHVHADASGRIINDYMREHGRERLSAELFEGFATIAR
jgi:hypothetical protein